MLSWKENRNLLVKLIKKLSDLYGGSDLDDLKVYAKEVINSHENDLEIPIACFYALIVEKEPSFIISNFVKEIENDRSMQGMPVKRVLSKKPS